MYRLSILAGSVLVLAEYTFCAEFCLEEKSGGHKLWGQKAGTEPLGNLSVLQEAMSAMSLFWNLLLDTSKAVFTLVEFLMLNVFMTGNKFKLVWR